MKLMITFCASLLFSFAALAGISSHRYANESYESARYRHFILRNFRYTPPNPAKKIPASATISAEDAKKPLNAIDLGVIADIQSYVNLETEFKYIRDTRFMATSDPNFPRRITWLYPDDGCYARAEMVKLAISGHPFPPLKKLFAFGELKALSKNTVSGTIQWWYHVAVAYRVGYTVYVFDPSIEAHRALTLQEWNDLIGGNQTPVQYSICSADTIDPTSDCYNPTAQSPEQIVMTQKAFLDSEWNRLLELHRSPEKELGNNPPWLGDGL
ncbi:MAG: protein-glutamine glutaminase family protein [Pseudobdellovibrionaceae bacterium]